jgi:3-methyladenine DNA glycosylase/8-oxoguanine DNA glycosylase
MTSFDLQARQPFNFNSVINSHGWIQLAPFRTDESGGTLFYTDCLANGRLVEYRVREKSGGVQMEVPGRLGKAEKAEVIAKITWMLGLDMDFTSFYKAARGEPKLRQARRLAHGRVLRSPTFFEDVVKTILTTNTLWAATIRMNQNLIEAFGASADGSEGRAFPTPERLASASTAALRKKVRVGYRAPAIHELARRVAAGKLDLESCKTSTLPTLELRTELLKIRGIGPYAAANLLMILGRPDFIPIDTYAMKMVSHEWHGGRPVTPKQVERAFRKWGEHKGLAFWFWDWKYDGG